MRLIKALILIGCLFPLMAAAQNSVKKATAPKARIVSINNGLEVPVESLSFGKEQILKITLDGGVQNINHKVYVTSTNASVKHLKMNEYSVIPLSDEKVDLIVDVETYEDYFFYQMKPKGKNKKMKKVLTTFPPEKYMVSYETFYVKK